MKARSGQNLDNKIAPQVNFNPTAVNIIILSGTCCVFLSSLKNTFFSVLVTIFSNKSYFCFSYTNTFFIHAMNYFSVVHRIIFLIRPVTRGGARGAFAPSPPPQAPKVRILILNI